MDRHDELILLLLRYAREHATGQQPLREPDFDGYTRDQVRYHIELCRQAGLLTVKVSGRRPRIVALTWSGHDRLAKHTDD